MIILSEKKGKSNHLKSQHLKKMNPMPAADALRCQFRIGLIDGLIIMRISKKYVFLYSQKHADYIESFRGIGIGADMPKMFCRLANDTIREYTCYVVSEMSDAQIEKYSEEWGDVVNLGVCTHI